MLKQIGDWLKGVVVKKTNAEKGQVTHHNRTLWFAIAMAFVKAAQSYFGDDVLSDEQAQAAAEWIVNGALIIAVLLSKRSMKPAVAQAADAQGVAEVAAVKTEAGIAPAAIEAAEPKVNLGVIKAADAQGEKEVAQARGFAPIE